MAKLALEHQLVSKDSQEDGQLSGLHRQLSEALSLQQIKQNELSQLRQQQTHVHEESDNLILKKNNNGQR